MKSIVAVLAVALGLFHASPALAGPDDPLRLPGGLCSDPEQCLCIEQETPVRDVTLCGFGDRLSR